MKKYKLCLLLCLVILVSGCSFELEINTNNDNDNDKNNSESTSSISLVVPDVSGMILEDARNILRLNGFTIGEVKAVYDENYEEGLVVKTSPEVGRSVEEGTLVDIYISTSLSYVVDDYTNKNYLVVKSELESLGLEVDVVEKAYLEKYEELIVVEQEPRIGTVLKKGDKVILYIAKVDFLYPDFVGEEWTITEVEEFCQKYEITLVKKYEASNRKEGMIIRQSRMAGTKIVNGSTLTITISGSEV